MPEIIFNGPEGRLQGRYTQSKVKDAPLALVLHPNPQHGGTMNNKINYLMYQMFAERGFTVMRFNFRGVGRSQGVFDEGEGELSDAAAALDYMQDMNPNAPFTWVGGFSFGALIAMQLLMRRPEIQGFISVAPPANTEDFTFLAPCPTSGLVLQGANDDVVTAEPVRALMDTLYEQKGIRIDYREIAGANHFFHGHTDEIVAHMHDHLNTRGAGQMIGSGQKTKMLAAAE